MKPKLKFQAKVLVPVVTVMALFLMGTMWLVNNRFEDQLQNETTALLSTAQTQFTNAMQRHQENLMRQFRPIPEGPDFFSIAVKFQNPSDDKKVAAETMRGALEDILDRQGVGTPVIAFASPAGQFLAGTNRDSRIDLRQFYAACVPFVKTVADTREAEIHTIQVGDSLFEAVVIPSFKVTSDELLGALIFGVEMDTTIARQVKSPNSEIAFIANDQVVASTLDQPDLQDVLLQDYKVLAAGSRKKGGAAASNPILEGEHFGAQPGKFPFFAGHGKAGYLLLVSYEKPLLALRDEQRFLLFCSLLGMALGSSIVWALVRRVTQPLRQLRDSAEAVGRGDFSRRIEIHSKDELGELAGVFNHMTENLQKSLAQLEKTVEILRTTQAQLVHSEKLSAVGEFVAGVAHELNNPLSSLIGYAELLQAQVVDDDARSSLKRICNSADRCHKIVQSLLSFARQHPPERKLTNVNTVIDSVVDILIYELRTSNIQIVKELSPNLPRLLVDPHQIQQVFLNIVNNARQAVEAFRPHGSIRISTGAKGQRVWIRFQDDGPGISTENLAKIFNPFFTTKPVGKGTGLGLSLSYGIIQEHGGSITAESKPGHGTTFIIGLPVTADADAGASQSAAPAPAPLPSGKGKSVLVVDDEEDISELIRKALEKQGYQIQTAADGEVALSHLRKTKYDLIISDWKMPGVNGQELYQRLLEIDPDATKRMIFMTGDVLSEKVELFLQERGKTCLAKPFSLVEFQQAIGKVIQEQSEECRN
jgi:two-component system, NtrC family, sensor kinase